MLMLKHVVPCSSWSTLPAHERTEVCVSAVSSPSHLYVQLVKNHTEYVVTENAILLFDH